MSRSRCIGSLVLSLTALVATSLATLTLAGPALAKPVAEADAKTGDECGHGGQWEVKDLGLDAKGNQQTEKTCKCGTGMTDVDASSGNDNVTCVSDEAIEWCQIRAEVDGFSKGEVRGNDGVFSCHIMSNYLSFLTYRRAYTCTPIFRGASHVCSEFLPNEEISWHVCTGPLDPMDFSGQCTSVDKELADHLLTFAKEIGLLMEPLLATTDLFPEIHFSQKYVGDFDGDGIDDLAVLIRRHYDDARRGDAWVALGDGDGYFRAPELWGGWVCPYTNLVCKVGDFDGDGRDDFFELGLADGGNGHVHVNRSMGTGFEARLDVWPASSGRDFRDFDVADMNGDGRDDVVLFRKGDAPFYQDGVYVHSGINGNGLVLLSDGVDGLGVPPTVANAGYYPDTTVERDTDRWGNDYRGFDVTSGGPNTCRQTCNGESACRAWTYVPPGVHGSWARCYLKDAVPAPSDAPRMISGVKYSLPEGAIWASEFCHDQDQCFAGELDGDTETGDLVSVPWDGTSYSDPRINTCTVFKTYDSWGAKVIGRRYDCDHQSVAWPSWLFLRFDLADANSDGLDDLVGFESDGDIEYGTSFDGESLTRVFDPPLSCQNFVSCHLGEVNGDGVADLIDITALSGWGELGEVHTTMDETRALDELWKRIQDGVAILGATPTEHTIGLGETVTVQLWIDLDQGTEVFGVDAAYQLVGLDLVEVSVDQPPTHYQNETLLTSDGGLAVDHVLATQVEGPAREELVTLTITGVEPGTFEIWTRPSEAGYWFQNPYRDELEFWVWWENQEYRTVTVMPEAQKIATVTIAEPLPEPGAALGLAAGIAGLLALAGHRNRRRG